MDYPGNLGYWYRGMYVFGIHADWPAYPGRGTGDALYELCQFPRGTTFQPIDDIDLCVLFVVSGQVPHADVWSKDEFHVAIWHSDLNELADEMLIDGIRSQDERDGSLEEHGGYLNNEYLIYDRQSSVEVTLRGWAELERLLQNEPVLSRFDRLQKLADLGMYDTAIRDAGAILETALKEATGSSKYGLRLVDIFVKKLENDQRYTDASVKRFRTDLRTAFKFIRNEFAHGIADVPRDRALALLVRFAALIESVRESNLRIPQALICRDE